MPYAPETPASGIEAAGYFDRCWYRRTIDTQAGDGRLMLHFEAADYDTCAWVDGRFVGRHVGGYTRFSFDITDAVDGRPTAEILVRCDDDPHDLAKPRGKQDWLPEPHAIWYPRTTGLWQTVWTERVPAARVDAPVPPPGATAVRATRTIWPGGARAAARRRAPHAVRRTPVFSGFCYTQFTDTYHEANGLLTMDRRPKFDVHVMSVATRGPGNPDETRLLTDLPADKPPA